MDLKGLSITELKAMMYDQSKEMDRIRMNMQILQAEIERRESAPTGTSTSLEGGK
jgi:uncharacterized coiled-coil protein SlyX